MGVKIRKRKRGDGTPDPNYYLFITYEEFRRSVKVGTVKKHARRVARKIEQHIACSKVGAPFELVKRDIDIDYYIFLELKDIYQKIEFLKRIAREGGAR